MEQKPKSMKTFFIIWSGQLVSMIGSGITSFALGVWIFEETGKATPFAMIALFSLLPFLILSPFAGSIVDRFNRRMILILSDTGSALTTLFALILLFSGNLQIWHIYLIAAFNSAFRAFQEPAYSASVTMMVPKKHLVRAAGLRQTGSAITTIFTPLIAGILYNFMDLKNIFVIDFVTFFFAVGALLFVRIPQPKREAQPEGEKKSIWRDAIFGWNYLKERKGLFILLWYFSMMNFFLGLSNILVTPMVLSFGTSADLGIAQSVTGFGLLLGSLLVGVWGGPKKKDKIPYLIGAIILAGSGYIIAGLQPNIVVIAAGFFVLLFFVPIASSMSQAIFQTKVAPSLQGRVFSIRGMIALAVSQIAYIVAGPLADKIVEPLMSVSNSNNSTAQFFSNFVGGFGPGRGIAIVFMFSGLCIIVFSLLIYLNPRVRNIDTDCRMRSRMMNLRWKRFKRRVKKLN